MRIRALMLVLFAVAASAVFSPHAPAAAPGFSLTDQQRATLMKLILSRASRAPAAERLPFAANDLSGALMFGEEEAGVDAAGKRQVCKGVIIELAAPQMARLQTRACAPLSAGTTYSAPAWAMAAPITSAATAADEGARPPAPSPAAPGATHHHDHRGPTAAPSAPSQPPPVGAVARTAPADNTSGAGGTGVGGGLDRVITPVLVELGPNQPRLPRHGGAGIVLLSEAPADRVRNLTLCRALFRGIDTATQAEIEAGSRQHDDEMQLLRPLYWPLKDSAKPAPGADRCVFRVDHYDFARAWRVRSKLALTGRGPYLLVERTDETRAGLVNFNGVRDSDVAELVRYFREGFSQEADVWDPARHTPGATQASLTAFFGRALELVELPRVIVVTTLRASCPLGDFLDVCANPLPR